MSIKKVVYEQKNTKKWVAEINDFKTPANSHINVVKNKIWEGVFDSIKEAEEAVQIELDRILRNPKCQYTNSNV
jgi:hypothetical protein